MCVCVYMFAHLDACKYMQEYKYTHTTLYIRCVGYHPPFSTEWTCPFAIYSSSY